MKRHLLYHITPIGSWLENIKLLKKHIKKIDGTKIAAIAQGGALPGWLKISADLKDLFDEVIFVQNDLKLRESASLLPLLKKAETFGWTERGITERPITLYAHTKGVTHKNNQAVSLWTEACYKHVFENLTEIERLFEAGYVTVGPFKRYGIFPHFPPGSFWHYSGTFYWFDNYKFFNTNSTTTLWREAIKPHKYGAEAYPSLVVPSHLAGCNFADGVHDLYNLEYCKQVTETGDVAPILHKRTSLEFKQNHTGRRVDDKLRNRRS